MSDYREELRVGKEILDARRRGVPQAPQHAAHPRRRTCTTSIRPPTRCRSTQLEEVDRYALARYADAAREDACAPTTTTTSRSIFQALNALATVDLSAFYVDVSKDRLYTLAARVARAAASAQTAMYLIADGLARLLAPILPVTADELWRSCPARARHRCTWRCSRCGRRSTSSPTRR